MDFLSLDVASQSIFSLFGDFMTIPDFQTLIFFLVIVSPFATPMDFYRGKICQNLTFHTLCIGGNFTPIGEYSSTVKDQ
jgi:hypothetical protein